MAIRAVVFDVYNTILEVGPPPADAARQWARLWHKTWLEPPRVTLEDFAAATKEIIKREHAAARAAGIPYPEIYWPDVTRQALPELRPLSNARCSLFLYKHAQMERTLRLPEGARMLLAELAVSNMPLGIVSNSQPYTLRELRRALRAENLSMSMFNRDLCFWSYRAGFSKPDAHVFRFLGARLACLGVRPQETLLVGDRLDNDIEPAKAHSWLTWQLKAAAESDGVAGGDWQQLANYLLKP